MHALRHCQCEVISAGADAPIAHLADLMDRNAVGCIVIVDDDERPLGVVTDRDLVRRVVAAGRDAQKTTAGDVMSRDPACAESSEPVAKVLERMRRRGVRRMPVLEGGRVTGVASLDDVVLAISADLWNLAEAVRIELRDSQRSVRRRRWNEQRQEALGHVGSQARHLGRALRELIGGELDHLVGSFRRPR